jgi:hypothetical protein
MAQTPAATRIQRRSRTIRRIAYVAAVLAILCIGSQLLLVLSPLWHGGDRTAALKSALAQADLAAPALFLVVGLMRARRLFRRLEAGEMFAAENSRDFGRVGWWVFGGAVWSLTLGGMAPVQTGPLAQELAGIGQGARDLALLALGLGLVVIGQVMAEARRLKTDNDSFL